MPCRLPQRDHLGVRGRVALDLTQVAPLADDRAGGIEDHGTDGHVPLVRRTRGELEGPTHGDGILLTHRSGRRT